MKKIKVPEQIKLLNPDGTESDFTFLQFLEIGVDQHQPFGKGLKGIRRGIKIMEIIEKGGEELSFDDDDFKEVKTAVENAGYSPRYARKMISFFNVFEESK